MMPCNPSCHTEYWMTHTNIWPCRRVFWVTRNRLCRQWVFCLTIQINRNRLSLCKYKNMKKKKSLVKSIIFYNVLLTLLPSSANPDLQLNEHLLERMEASFPAWTLCCHLPKQDWKLMGRVILVVNRKLEAGKWRMPCSMNTYIHKLQKKEFKPQACCPQVFKNSIPFPKLLQYRRIMLATTGIFYLFMFGGA